MHSYAAIGGHFTGSLGCRGSSLRLPPCPGRGADGETGGLLAARTARARIIDSRDAMNYAIYFHVIDTAMQLRWAIGMKRAITSRASPDSHGPESTHPAARLPSGFMYPHIAPSFIVTAASR